MGHQQGDGTAGALFPGEFSQNLGVSVSAASIENEKIYVYLGYIV